LLISGTEAHGRQFVQRASPVENPETRNSVSIG
jgi:hypothetical protein